MVMELNCATYLVLLGIRAEMLRIAIRVTICKMDLVWPMLARLPYSNLAKSITAQERKLVITQAPHGVLV